MQRNRTSNEVGQVLVLVLIGLAILAAIAAFIGIKTVRTKVPITVMTSSWTTFVATTSISEVEGEEIKEVCEADDDCTISDADACAPGEPDEWGFQEQALSVEEVNTGETVQYDSINTALEYEIEFSDEYVNEDGNLLKSEHYANMDSCEDQTGDGISLYDQTCQVWSTESIYAPNIVCPVVRNETQEGRAFEQTGNTLPVTNNPGAPDDAAFDFEARITADVEGKGRFSFFTRDQDFHESLFVNTEGVTVGFNWFGKAIKICNAQGECQ